MPNSFTNPNSLCTIDELEKLLYAPCVRILDGSFFLPNSGRNPHDGYVQAHIPGARFFDIDQICDLTNPLPHMLPTAEAFATAVGALGIGNADRVIVYDQPGSFAAARVWWTFQVFGHANVAVVDGGLPAWIAAGLPVSDTCLAIEPVEYTACFDGSKVRGRADVLAAISNPSLQIVDNRPASRYAGRDPEPRPTTRRGHVPGSHSLPFGEFLDAGRHGAWRPKSELTAAFARAGIDPSRPMIAYCGSGVSACTTAFAAHLLGFDTVSVYDGSWSEWGNSDAAPVEQ
ncbi:MAG: sulfurtransferase [Rhodospirillales bacterium]|nr:sulfurtransferase [Rhodospirillales bacterium]